MRVVVAPLFVACACAFVAGCPTAPPSNELVVTGKMERDGVSGDTSATAAKDVPISFGSKNARGEWWTCELRMTATACDGDKHLNAWIALPNITSLDQLGNNGCVGTDGKPFGAFELLTQKRDAGEPAQIGSDVQVLVLAASDKDGDGVANLADDKETLAASRFLNGTVEVDSIGSFNDPVSLKIGGLTALDSFALDITMDGPTSPVPNPPTLDKPSSCVPGDAVTP